MQKIKLNRTEVLFNIEQLNYQKNGLDSIINDCEFYIENNIIENDPISEQEVNAKETGIACKEEKIKIQNLIEKFEDALTLFEI